ncbi:MAG: amidohydrolase [Bauldia sp.]|nr:amidohydrolase [Bauldia sp.]
MRIDVHHHFLTRGYLAARERHGIRTGPGFESALAWTPEGSLARMDEAGVDVAILSHTSNWTPYDAHEAGDLTREANDFAAGLVKAHPTRFGFFAALPMPDVAASLAEIARAFDVLGADGVSTTTNYGTSWPGDARFDPVFAELDRRAAVVFVHPQAPAVALGLVPPVPDATVEFMFDVVRCITAMLFRGTFTRFPRIRFIFTHGAGGLPALADRIDRNARLQPAVAERLPEGAIAALRRLHVDITTSTSAPSVAALRAFLPGSQLLFGSDFPFVAPAVTASGLAASAFTEAERAAIDSVNALRLFPRLARS